MSLLDKSADYLGAIAQGQGDSLEELLASLEGKRERLASSPSIWPSQGWLTSRFGYRISPFTEPQAVPRRHRHRGHARHRRGRARARARGVRGPERPARQLP